MDRSVYNDPDRWGNYTEISATTPNYYQLLSTGGELPDNYYLWRRDDGISPICVLPLPDGRSVTERTARGLTTASGSIVAGVFDTSVNGQKRPCTSLDNRLSIASNRLRTKVRDSKVDLGVCLGEYKETAEFFISSVNFVTKCIHHAKRGNISGLMRDLTGRSNTSLPHVVQAASDVWLKLKYGLQPLVKDVYNATKAYEDSRKRKFAFEVARTSNKEDCTVSVQDTSLPDWSFFSVLQGSCSVRGKVTYIVENPLIRTLDQCGVTNPLSVGWELIPFSFVVDWFIPVGAYLQNVVPPMGVSVKRAVLTSKITGETSFRSVNPSASWDTSATIRSIRKERRILSDLPSASLVIPDLSITKDKIVTSLALLVQQYYGR